ncbi:MAG: ATP-dependent nuclease [Anaerolineae bacterium]|jgi:putative ATP-dependent endonuclease of OLD family
MKIRHVSIRNFRGVRELDWVVDSDMVCLIGSGSSCKSTILHAIEYALAPRWSLPLTDDDFHQGDTSNPIRICVTVTGLPDRIASIDSFGLMLRGWHHRTHRVVDEPIDDSHEAALTVQLRVTDSLEPEWTVVNDREPEGRPIDWRSRQALGLAVVGGYVDRELTWARGSTLSRALGNDDTILPLLAGATRAVRETVKSASLDELMQQCGRLGEEAAGVGVALVGELRPGLDLVSGALTGSVLSLYAGDVPLRQDGLGNRRLLTTMLQHLTVPDGAIIVVDELEYGLEPARIRRLVEYLRPKPGDSHQVICATHSPIAIVQHKADEIHVVRRCSGRVSVAAGDDSLQGAIRALSEAMLSSRILLCEGQTEWGMSQALEQYWIGQGRPPLSYLDVAFACPSSGGGSSVPKYAMGLKRLGYDVAIWCDADRKLSVSDDQLQQSGIRLIQWPDGHALETQLFLDVPVCLLDGMVALACQDSANRQSVEDSLSARYPDWSAGSPASALIEKHDPCLVRACIGNLAKCKKWYKSIELGHELGKLVLGHLDDMAATESARVLRELEEWIYGD